jgi:hypothetical protein
LGGAEERVEGWFGGVDALDLVYVCGIDGGGEGAEEEGGGREGGRYGVSVEAGEGLAIVPVGFWWGFEIVRKGSRRWLYLQ